MGSATNKTPSAGAKIFLGIVTIAWALVLVWIGSSLYETAHMVRTDGIVIDHVKSYSPDGNNAYTPYFSPVLKFQIAGGGFVTINGTVSSVDEDLYKIGDKIPVYYDPRHPKDSAIIATFAQRWFAVCIVCVLLAAVTGIALLIYVGERNALHRRKRKSSQHPASHEARTPIADPASPGKADKRPKSILRNSAFLLVLGILIAMWAALLFSAWDAILKPLHMTRAEGVVVDMAGGRDQMYQYSPVVRFSTSDGTPVTITGRHESDSPPYQIGESIPVYYDPSRPETGAIIDSFAERWFDSTILALFTSIPTGIIGALLFFGRNKASHDSSTQGNWLGVGKLTGLSFLLAGCVILAFGVSNMAHQIHIGGAYARAQGTVVDFDYVSGSPSSSSSTGAGEHAIISFQTEQGQRITFRSGTGLGFSLRHAGSSVDVLYDRTTPQKALINSFMDRWAIPLLLVVMGLVFFVLGIVVYWISAVQRRHKIEMGKS